MLWAKCDKSSVLCDEAALNNANAIHTAAGEGVIVWFLYALSEDAVRYRSNEPNVYFSISSRNNKVCFHARFAIISL